MWWLFWQLDGLKLIFSSKPVVYSAHFYYIPNLPKCLLQSKYTLSACILVPSREKRFFQEIKHFALFDPHFFALLHKNPATRVMKFRILVELSLLIITVDLNLGVEKILKEILQLYTSYSKILFTWVGGH